MIRALLDFGVLACLCAVVFVNPKACSSEAKDGE